MAWVSNKTGVNGRISGVSVHKRLECFLVALFRSRITYFLVLHTLALADGLNESVSEFRILEEHGADEADAEQIMNACRILADRYISYHLYHIAAEIFLTVGNACAVNESDIAFPHGGFFKNDIAGVTLFELFLK